MSTTDIYNLQYIESKSWTFAFSGYFLYNTKINVIHLNYVYVQIPGPMGSVPTFTFNDGMFRLNIGHLKYSYSAVQTHLFGRLL